MAKVFIMDHPLVQHKVTMLRDKNTSTKDFRELAEEISLLMAYEVTRDLPLKDIEVETPICKTVAKTVAGRSLGIVPILRAGLGMVNGMLRLVPNAKVGHIGLYLDDLVEILHRQNIVLEIKSVSPDIHHPVGIDLRHRRERGKQQQ